MRYSKAQKTSVISISERHHFWAYERFELESRRDRVSQSLTWMLLLSWFSIVFASLWGMAKTEHTATTRVYMPPLHIHVTLHGLDNANVHQWAPSSNVCTWSP